jgi:methylmalonyl-CoA mutase
MTQELAFAMNKLVQYAEGLTSKGLTVQQIFSNVMFQAGITGDFFFEIAKLRALRALFTTIAIHYKISHRPVHILSMSSLWSKSLFDAYTNMLRNTTEGLSAVAGGCDALLIKPHNHRHETFSNRMAVNISHILRAESYVDQVADVAEGSYYLEAITFALYENALNLFKEIESAGGYETAADQGIIQDKIKALRERKLQDVATRKQVYVGVNQYADPAEVLPFTELPADQKSGILTPQRATRAFEELRLHTLQLVKTTGKTAEVYLAAFGNLAMRKARVAFAQNFFAAAGFQTTEYYHENLLVGLPSITGSQAGIVVLCSSDEDYAQQAEEFAKTFRQQAKGKILVLAGYPPDQVDKLRAAGIDQFIHIRSNAVEVLIGLQQQVFNGKQRV